MEDLLQVGIITSTHGVRGEVKVYPTTDDPRRFRRLKEVVLDTGKEKMNLEIEGVKFFKQFVILKFKGLDNINDIEKYRQKSLYVTRKNAVRLQRDEYFIADLIGLKVQDEDGKELGTVKDVIETGANDVYEVEMADGKSLLLPAIKQCILNVDVENGTMQVYVLEGLLDYDEVSYSDPVPRNGAAGAGNQYFRPGSGEGSDFHRCGEYPGLHTG